MPEKTCDPTLEQYMAKLLEQLTVIRICDRDTRMFILGLHGLRKSWPDEGKMCHREESVRDSYLLKHRTVQGC